MSAYTTRWCKEHGDWDDDVDSPAEGCPICVEKGLFKTRAQLERELAEEQQRALKQEGLRYQEAQRADNAELKLLSLPSQVPQVGIEARRMGELLADAQWRTCVGLCVNPVATLDGVATGNQCGREFISRERFDEHIAPLLKELGDRRQLDHANRVDAILSAPLSPQAPKDELAWLIACKNHEGQLVGWLGLWDNEDYGWTLDPNKAIRFARQKDADMMLSNWGVEDGCILTSEEHMWL